MQISSQSWGRLLPCLLALVLLAACVPFRDPSLPDEPYVPSAPAPVPFVSPLGYREAPMQVPATGIAFRTLAANALREPAPPAMPPELVGPAFLPNLSIAEWAQVNAAPAVRLIGGPGEVAGLDPRVFGQETIDLLRRVNYQEDAAILYAPGVMSAAQDVYITHIYSPLGGEAPPGGSDSESAQTVVVYPVHRHWSVGPAQLTYPFHVVVVARNTLPPAALQYDLIRAIAIYTSADAP